MRNELLHQSNMSALRKTYPQYSDMLSAVPESQGYTFAAGPSAVTCRDSLGRWLHGPDDPWKAAQGEAALLVSDEPHLYIVLRPGLGYQALAIIEALEEKHGAGSVVLVVEDRFDLFRASLAYTNWAPILRSASAVLLLGSPEAVLEAFLARHAKLSLMPITLITGSATPDNVNCAKLVERLTELSRLVRSSVGEELAGTDFVLNERRNRREPLRVLLAGEHGYLLGPFTDGFRGCGCSVEALAEEKHTPRNVRAHDWLARMAPLAPDLVLWMNRPELSLFASTVFRELGIANVVWSVDSPRRARLTRSELSTVDLHLYFDVHELPRYGPFGARQSEQLSLAAGIEPLPGCGPHDRDWPTRLGPDISFVGTLGETRVGELRESIRQVRPEDLAFLDELAGSPEDAGPFFEEETGKRYTGLPVLYIDEVRTTRRRLDVLSRFPRSSLSIFGGMEWAGERSPLADCYAGRAVRYGAELSSVYYHSRINVNVFHAQCVDSTNSRVYDVLAAGGFLLTEDRPVLHREFEIDRHLVTFSSPAEASDKAAYYLANPAEREAIAREGQRHVLANHAFVQRCRRLLRRARPFMGVQRDA